MALGTCYILSCRQNMQWVIFSDWICLSSWFRVPCQRLLQTTRDWLEGIMFQMTRTPRVSIFFRSLLDIQWSQVLTMTQKSSLIACMIHVCSWTTAGRSLIIPLQDWKHSPLMTNSTGWRGLGLLPLICIQEPWSCLKPHSTAISIKRERHADMSKWDTADGQ